MIEMLDQLSENENLGFSIPKNREDLTVTSSHKFKERRNNPRFYLYFEAIITNTNIPTTACLRLDLRNETSRKPSRINPVSTTGN